MRRLAPMLAAALVFGSALAGPEDTGWESAVSLYGYAVPGSENYLNPNIATDHGMLHLEGRHNYEGIGTWSLWMGANFEAGTKWVFEATVMGGGVFGDLEGVAPGFRLSLSRSWFYFASEGEYFIDTHDHEGNYFYTWNEIAGSPTDWFRLGLAGQRTRAYESEIDIQRGPFVGFTYKAFDAAVYVFNLEEDPTTVVSVRFEF